ncbi:MAG TPA: response regulator [Hyphomicrobiaceae bacterium]|nr:response regulator [Hyphomicrobiaceae bacterium]
MPEHKSVLIIEDESVIALDIQEMLYKNGFDALVASNAEEALRILGDRKVDMAIVDFFLGHGNATEIALALKKRGVPFLLCSATLAFKDIETDAFDAVPFLQKPFSDQQLLDLLASL